MENLEKILIDEIVSQIDGTLDPLQYDYHAGKSVEQGYSTLFSQVAKLSEGYIFNIFIQHNT